MNNCGCNGGPMERSPCRCSAREWLQPLREGARLRPERFRALSITACCSSPLVRMFSFLLLGGAGLWEHIALWEWMRAERFTISTRSMPSICMKQIRIWPGHLLASFVRLATRYRNLLELTCECQS